MRAYTRSEQERIALASRQARSRTADTARTLETQTELANASHDELMASETPELIQLLVDLESESKFKALMRMISRRLRWI